jgi:hypothetical protein
MKKNDNRAHQKRYIQQHHLLYTNITKQQLKTHLRFKMIFTKIKNFIIQTPAKLSSLILRQVHSI